MPDHRQCRDKVYQPATKPALQKRKTGQSQSRSKGKARHRSPMNIAPTRAPFSNGLHKIPNPKELSTDRQPTAARFSGRRRQQDLRNLEPRTIALPTRRISVAPKTERCRQRHPPPPDANRASRMIDHMPKSLRPALQNYPARSSRQSPYRFNVNPFGSRLNDPHQQAPPAPPQISALPDLESSGP